MNFVPWPPDPAGIQALQSVRESVGLNVPIAVALRSCIAAAELVQRFAPDAPQGIKNEALVRVVGYLVDQPSSATRSETQGDVATSFAATHVSALRHSGGMALLSPWKIRRAGAI